MRGSSGIASRRSVRSRFSICALFPAVFLLFPFSAFPNSSLFFLLFLLFLLPFRPSSTFLDRAFQKNTTRFYSSEGYVGDGQFHWVSIRRILLFSLLFFAAFFFFSFFLTPPVPYPSIRHIFNCFQYNQIGLPFVGAYAAIFSLPRVDRTSIGNVFRNFPAKRVTRSL